ncbi:orotate phosphoribosyltransferase [Chloroflexota bacterium]
MVNAEEVFVESGTKTEGHFLLTSGLHSPVYWEKFRVLQFPQYTEQLCRIMAEHFRPENPQVVVGPTTGGVILSFEVARQLGLRGLFVEKNDSGERTLKRGFNIGKDERVLIVDDILTTGGSVREVVSAVKKAGGDIIGIAVMVDRSGGSLHFGNIPLFACLSAETIAYRPDDCPLCRTGVPLIKPGSSKPEA